MEGGFIKGSGTAFSISLYLSDWKRQSTTPRKKYWPAFPDDPQTTGDKVVSVFEFSDCLFSDCLFACSLQIF